MDTHSCELFVTHIISLIKENQTQFMLEFRFKAGQVGIINYDISPREVLVLVDARSNYTGIWVCQSNKSKWDLVGSDFKFYSCHDSCWRSDGMRWIFQNFIEMRDELRFKITQEGRKYNLAEVNAAVTMFPGVFFQQGASFETPRGKDGLPMVADLKFS